MLCLLPRLLLVVACVGLTGPALLPAAGASYQAMPLSRRQELQAETRVLIRLLESAHYRSKPFVELDAPALLRGYLARLDPLHLYFLASDEQYFVRRFGRSLKASYLLSGDLYPAFEMFDRLRDRIAARHAWVRARLEQPFELASDTTFDPFRQDAAFPADAAAADALWERALTAELIEELLHAPDDDQARAHLRRRYEQSDENCATIRAENIAEQFLNALLALHDPHSGYMAWDTLLDLEAELTGSVVGIGADLKLASGRIVVESLAPGGAAETSGQLHPGDSILAVAEAGGEPAPLAGLPLQEVVRRIRGRIDSQVALEVEAAATGTRRTVTLTRMQLQSDTDRATARLYDVPDIADGHPVPIGVVELPSFYGGSEDSGELAGAAEDVRELLEKLQTAGAVGLVLDLRDNPGGLTDEAGMIVGHFIDRGTVLITRNAEGRVESTPDPTPGTVFSRPLIVLTSPDSASSSEIAAGALQSYGRAIVVGGATTFGKGTSQAGLPLRHHAAPDTHGSEHWGELRVTSQYFFLPDGRSTQQRGVVSDIVLPFVQPPFSRRESDLPGALPWKAQPVADFSAQQAAAVPDEARVTPALLASLRARTEERRRTLPEFGWYERAVAMYQEFVAPAPVPLHLEERRTTRTIQRERREASQREKQLLSGAAAYASRPVTLDAVAALARVHQEHLTGQLSAVDGARPDRWVAGVYYHAPTDAQPWRELRLANLDPDMLADGAGPLASAFASGAGVELSADAFSNLLAAPAEAGDSSATTWDARLAAANGFTMDDPRLADGFTALSASLIAIQPHLVGGAPLLDVPLRESLRLAADWAANNSKTP